MTMLAILQKGCTRSSGRVPPLFRSTRCGEPSRCGHSFTCCCSHLMRVASLRGGISLSVLVSVVSATAYIATAAASDQAATSAAPPTPDSGTSAAAGDRQGEQTISPRIVRVAIVGGGISSAATATFLSIMEQQLQHERTAKQQMDKKHRTRGDYPYDAYENAVPSDEENLDDSEEEPGDNDQWWMDRPIKLQIDIYEASGRFGGRMVYTDVAGRIVELGDAGASVSNFWMKVFHDLLNEYADDVKGGPGRSVRGDLADAAAAAGEATAGEASEETAADPAVAEAAAEAADDTAAAAAQETAAAADEMVAASNGTDDGAAGEAIPALPADDTTAANANSGAAPPEATTAANSDAAAVRPPEAAAAAEVYSEAVSHAGISRDDAPAEFASEDDNDKESPKELQQERANRDDGEQVGYDGEQDDGHLEARTLHQDDCCLQRSDTQLGTQESGPATDNDLRPQGDGPEGRAATAAAPAAASGAAPPGAYAYFKNGKKTFTLPSILTEFEEADPPAAILLHGGERATTINSLPDTLLEAGAAALIEPLGPIIRTWKRVYDFTFGGKGCARRAALSLFRGTENYIAPSPYRQHRNGRPYCSVLKQIKAAARTGAGFAKALGLHEEITYPFARILKMYYVDWKGHRLIDGLLRGFYGQRSTAIHALAGTLALAATYNAPYANKRYSGQVVVEFLIARFADNSFLHCPIHKIVELEDEIINTSQEDRRSSARGTAADTTITDVAGDPSGAADGASANGESRKQHASNPSKSTKAEPKRRKRFRLEPGEDGVCSNDEARQHLESTTYDFVVIATPLEGSSLTVYRRVRLRAGKRKATKENAADQGRNVSKQTNEKPSPDEARRAFFQWFAAQSQKNIQNGDVESREKTGETHVPVDTNSAHIWEAANTKTLRKEAQRGQQEAQNGSSQGGELQQPTKDQAEHTGGNQRLTDTQNSQWTLKKVKARRRPYVGVHVTCTAADGLVRHGVDTDRMEEKKDATEYLDRPDPMTLLTSDSLSQRYYSFGELFVATCHDVTDDELEQVVGIARLADKDKRPLVLFFTRKEEEQKRRRREANTSREGEDGKPDTTGTTKQEVVAPPTEKHDQNHSSVPANGGSEIGDKFLSSPSSTKAEGQQSEAQAPKVKKPYFTGKALSPLADEGFFSRIQELMTPPPKVGDTICCAVTERELNETNLADIFINVSGSKRWSWHFARPKMYPILRKGRELPYIWGLKEDPFPTVVPGVTKFVLLEHVFYTSAFESVLSSTEGAIVAAKNVANLIIKEIMAKYDN